MPYRRDPNNGYIYHRSEDPDLYDFVRNFWWSYGGSDYAQYSIDRPPLAGYLYPKELKRFEDFYGAKAIRVNWTLIGLWGSWIAVTKRYFENPRTWAKDERVRIKHKLELCNELILQGFPHQPYEGRDRKLMSIAFFYERSFMLQWRYREDWEDEGYKAAMIALRDISSMIYKGECRVPTATDTFR